MYSMNCIKEHDGDASALTESSAEDFLMNGGVGHLLATACTTLGAEFNMLKC